MKNNSSLLVLVGIGYIGVAVIGSAFPILVLLVMLVSPRATLPEFNSDSLAFWAYRIVAVVPAFVIGYALLRRRNWGRYVLIAYNLWWLVLMTYVLLTQSFRGTGIEVDLARLDPFHKG